MSRWTNQETFFVEDTTSGSGEYNVLLNHIIYTINYFFGSFASELLGNLASATVYVVCFLVFILSLKYIRSKLRQSKEIAYGSSAK